MSKATSLSLPLLGLLLFAFLTQAARPEPSDLKPTGEQPKGVLPEEKYSEPEVVVEGCGDECMMRRTLEAHLDYIYTQEKKN